ncbi:penicillin-binding transpeptidase domain-containing protein [Oceanirhabdus sp. W0125-5]|uniref:penicillin-binding transpeptidase domain-containing protein n=1 Tax=Oceanirhabdus sp. W0125-5 TaxID=2999116 RepID=UPI0022F2D312|nr:penicillin-binding transpeptidase domain-containing protein [Oceanirhabdus sp. W0125-5]WBW95864.1 penicillin-binding transpeptidase domain-containing protein [Oceanirhabdus sp. W0125-5]
MKNKEEYKELKAPKKKKKFTRYTAMVVIMSLIFATIVGKLIYLQVFNVEVYREKANNGRHKVISNSAPRGNIFDTNGEILATNKQGFSLIFTETNESKENFFLTIKEVFAVLEENGEGLSENFPLKVEPIRFEFNVAEDWIVWSELRFKKDRGLDEAVMKEKFKGKKLADLNEEEKASIEEELKVIEAEEVFRTLIKKYCLYNILKENYSNEEWKELLNDKEALIDLLLESVPHEEIRNYMIVKDNIQMQSYKGYRPVIIANDLKVETAYVFEQIQSELPGISILKQPIRYYPYGELASNIVGYIGKIDEQFKGLYEERGYDVHEDYIGRSGIEGEYEKILRGTRGEESIEVNKDGRKVKTLGERPATPGESIYLTIDSNLQKAAEEALDQTMAYMRDLGKYKADKKTLDDVDKSNATRGAAVVIDVKTGEILALASRPGIDLNLFTVPGRLDSATYKSIFSPNLEEFGMEYVMEHELYKNEEINGKDLKELSEEERIDVIFNELFPKNKNGIREDRYDIYPKAAFNYSTKSRVPPGSIFKILTSVAGLEEAVISPTEKIYDVGPYTKRYKDFKGASWMYNLYRGSHGNQDVQDAIRDSNNYYFFEVADRLYEKGGEGTKESLDMLAKYSWKYGLGANMEDPASKTKTGIEIDEAFGQVYYYDSGKRYHSRVYTWSLYEHLINGTASIWVGEYKPINIVPDDEVDSEEVYAIKKKLTIAIKEEMMSVDKADLSTIDELLRELTEKNDEYKGQYTDKDINGIKRAISSSINDARTEIKSAVNLYNASIGQGLNQFTPLQLANYIATLVNGGYRYKLHLVDKIVDSEGNIIEDYGETNIILDETNVSPETVDVIKKGMQKVTSTPAGTAYSTFNNFPIKNGGKTGSATYQSNQDEYGRTSYATYVGFAPYEEPEIAVSVVIFDGGHGGYSARVAKGIYEEYFKEQILEQNPEYEFMLKQPEIEKENEN